MQKVVLQKKNNYKTRNFLTTTQYCKNLTILKSIEPEVMRFNNKKKTKNSKEITR
jgi:hypothetical protein